MTWRTIEERNAAIVRMRKKGVPPYLIVRTLDVTKNVVAGVLFRAGLTDSNCDAATGRGMQYADEIKQQALALGARRAEKKLGIPRSTVQGWRRRARQAVAA